MAGGWVRDIAKTLAMEARGRAKTEAVLRWSEHIHEMDALPVDFWFGKPEMMRRLSEHLKVLWLAIEGAPVTGLQGSVGTIVVDPEDYGCESREVFDRWETATSFGYTLYVDWLKVTSLDFLDVPIPEVAAELVH